MALVLIHAQAPWGPVSLRTAADVAEVLARGQAPAHMVDVGERDPGEVIAEAARMMRPTDGGWFAETVATTSNFVAQAVLRVPSAAGGSRDT